jgi:DNA-binding response OmpR family regulator
MEVQEVKLNPTAGDIIHFSRDVAFSFSDLSEKKNIDFSFHSTVDKLEISFDHNKVERILFNLISNAFKFTSEGGKVSVDLEVMNHAGQKLLLIKVTDTGIGIPVDQINRIFDRFFQSDTPSNMVNQGSGIGLSITKEFVRIHGGNIAVESEPDKGTCFTIELPVNEIATQQATSELIDNEEYSEEVEHYPVATDHPTKGVKRKPVLLLVEDNEDFRFYLKDNLRFRYHIIEAQNGKVGWAQAVNHIPDLIVSDVMMPEMDGIDLCRKIRMDARTSHIPLILLTARSAEDQVKQGFESGADDYVVKPFSFEILQARIKNMLDRRAVFQKSFTQKVDIKASEIKVSSLDEKLIANAVKYVEEKIADPDFSVEDLSHELGMSRVHLYKKLTSLTGKSPIEFIRTRRLQHAAQLLEKSQLTVAEVAYKVGFNNPKYFAKYFKEQFNILPSLYASNKKFGNQNM